MTDTLWGKVISVIDGDTFEVLVSRSGPANKYQYDELERVRIYGLDAPELNDSGGNRAKTELDQYLLGRNVKCLIHSRDAYGRLVATVYRT